MFYFTPWNIVAIAALKSSSTSNIICVCWGQSPMFACSLGGGSHLPALLYVWYFWIHPWPSSPLGRMWCAEAAGWAELTQDRPPCLVVHACRAQPESRAGFPPSTPTVLFDTTPHFPAAGLAPSVPDPMARDWGGLCHCLPQAGTHRNQCPLLPSRPRPSVPSTASGLQTFSTVGSVGDLVPC